MSKDLEISGGSLVRVTAAAPALSFNELMDAAKVVAASKLFPNIDTTEKAATLMMVCQAEGLHPIQAMRRYHIVQNRPTMRADAMQAEFQARGGTIEWHQHDAEACEATFSHPLGGTLTIRWDLARARKAGLFKNTMWNTYPEEMLHARCIGSGVRAILPAVVVGIYTPEEVEDMAADKETRTANPTRPAPATPTATPASKSDDSKRQFNLAVNAFVAEVEAEGFGAEINTDKGLSRKKVAALVGQLLDLEPFGDGMPTAAQLDEARSQVSHWAAQKRQAAQNADAIDAEFDGAPEDPFADDPAPATPATPYDRASRPEGAM